MSIQYFQRVDKSGELWETGKPMYSMPNINVKHSFAYFCQIGRRLNNREYD